ncbi:helix-turn-helix domain-containing protein [Psychrobacter phenylpyruvicus]|uniref:Transcriptional regulator, y4mF family n=1 Tax=Psychrobacter phenylpyruvicus TaxID=29432 RepID=A0A379LLM7_9GAMM|nr:helix-turn-helix transcriptional regulator [Psychrobacter phenylpyruvicus]SUD91331.1 transcriptional regulator, y4mF family [Psychrobacter phenylpyruvicus]
MGSINNLKKPKDLINPKDLKRSRNLRKSIHSFEHEFLRQYLINRRKDLGLTQRELADRMGVIYSFIGKVETGDRRLDIIEFIQYCAAIELDPTKVINEIKNKVIQENEKLR